MTMCRPAVMQTWPWCRNALQAPAELATSRSASSRTMSALLPPSSSETRLRDRPAASPTRRPTAVEPVKAIIATFGSCVSAEPASASPGRTCSRPSGSPAASNSRATRMPPETGVCTSGLRMTALPRASAGATARTDRICGKFHGLITPTTPSGIRRAIDSRPGSLVGSRWPHGWVGSAAASHSSASTSWTSKAALPGTAPPSRTSQVSNSSWLSSRTRAARRIRAARSGPVWAAQAGWAAAAARAACSTSPLLASPTSARTSPVAGSKVCRVPPCAAVQPLL